jgi:3-methyladenine DNA glycosylase/8-oxoguanine DNA glycosylase
LKKIDEQKLRDLKVGYRAKSIKKIDEQFGGNLLSEKELREEGDWEVIKDKLLELYGIGPATVWYLSGDIFHRWEVFQHVSPWEQKIYSKLFFNKNTNNPVPTEKVLKYFEKFGRYKQLAVHYI